MMRGIYLRVIYTVLTVYGTMGLMSHNRFRTSDYSWDKSVVSKSREAGSNFGALFG